MKAELITLAIPVKPDEQYIHISTLTHKDDLNKPSPDSTVRRHTFKRGTDGVFVRIGGVK